MYYSKTCNYCGCIMRKVRPGLVIINLQVVLSDDPGDEKVWVCPNPNCKSPNA